MKLKFVKSSFFNGIIVIAVLLLFSCGCSDNSTSPDSDDYAAQIQGKYKITTISSASGTATIPDNAQEFLIATRLKKNTIKFVQQLTTGTNTIDNVDLTKSDGVINFKYYYTDGIGQATFQNNQVEFDIELTTGEWAILKGKKI
jgi:hypothetical protein